MTRKDWLTNVKSLVITGETVTAWRDGSWGRVDNLFVRGNKQATDNLMDAYPQGGSAGGRDGGEWALHLDRPKGSGPKH